jgi:hypothetical protein
MWALVQEEYRGWQYIDLGEYVLMARFASADAGFQWRDFRHSRRAAARGRGLVFQTGEREFYAVGAGLRLLFRKKAEPRAALISTHASDFLAMRLMNYVALEEGHFEGDAWVAVRRRNGDESDHGVWVEPDAGLVRIELCD